MAKLTRLLGLTAVLLLAFAGLAHAVSPTPSPPPNDNRDSAQPLGGLPATVSGTTVGATVEATEPPSGCAQTAGSVWYSVTFGASPPNEVGVKLQANGDLDAVVDVWYQRQRSQNLETSCANTDAKGFAGTTFQPSSGTTYLIRVAQRVVSTPDTFSLRVFVVPPPVSAPGPTLGVRGGHGVLDSIFDTQDAYSLNLQAGTTYKFNLVNAGDGCMSLGMFPPGTHSFDGNDPTARLDCAGYRLFTPQISGRWSFLVSAAPNVDGSQPYSLHVAPATTDDMAPGISLPNLSRYTSALRGNLDTVVRLFQFDVTSLSELTLSLKTGSAFDLKLLNARGRELDCECGDSGGQTIQRELGPGRYYAVVSAQNFDSGSFTLVRVSRTITHTRVSFDGHGYEQISPGASTQVTATVSPAAAGTVTFELEYFDPVAGWQFRGFDTAKVVDGRAVLPFTPPETGHWRATVVYNGSTSAAPSTGNCANLFVAGPLTE